ncbi:MAG: phosphohydrolase [Betaproteobacteria bacterium HGW-Betaproteobacteria-10]|nr:MAG: phosphohydrolase [Betaproteobacteria bacterium HGW-Betaproteobacteria-10]
MKHTVSVDRLQPGVFISLSELSWLDHPFLLNRFRLSTQAQISVLRQLGLTEVEWDPMRSTTEPLPVAVEVVEEIDFSASALDSMLDVKRHRADRVRVQRDGLARCERLFEQETVGMSEILHDLGARPNESFSRAKSTVSRLVSGLVSADSVAVHLVNMKSKEPGLAHHAMNVMVISLLLGKEADATEDEMRALGLGALFHDVGKTDVPSRVLRNAQRTAAEEQFYQAHVGYGIKNVAAVRDMPLTVKNIIACHHERWDGSGFPNHIVGGKIPKLARIVAIANRYDNLCNPFDLKIAKTPAEAVSHMFRREAEFYDPELLQIFVKALGVYPPGSFVALSDGSIGLVIETNSNDLLHPLIMLHDPTVPRNEALLLDLSEAEAKIEGALSPAKLPIEVVEYLAPRGRIDYYIDAAAH